MLKKFKGNKICNIKKFWKIKFDMKRVTLKPNLIFNLVMFLGDFSV